MIGCSDWKQIEGPEDRWGNNASSLEEWKQLNIWMDKNTKERYYQFCYRKFLELSKISLNRWVLATVEIKIIGFEMIQLLLDKNVELFIHQDVTKSLGNRVNSE